MADHVGHAPGPWEWNDHDPSLEFTRGRIERHVNGKVQLIAIVGDGVNDPRLDATGQLIAAAPELLHAVRELQWLSERQLRTAAFSDEENERAGQALDAAREAIDKAEGRS